ncbi:MAG: sigma-70 family RNA polymerase sigma factor [Firmicutes bacterium]|nr:sigma-70 family RNA polymerase sigma factor [Candidatus Fermentithermobacillaceae bacterium]
MPLDLELLQRARQGDKASRDKIFQQNAGLIRACVLRYRGLGELDDLFQQGAIGLLKAIDRFDPSYGVEFSTYAVPVILGEIRRYLRDNSPLRIPRELRELAFKARKVEAEFCVSRGRQPSAKEVAEAMGVELGELVEALESVRAPLELDGMREEDGRDTVADPNSTATADLPGTEYLDLKMALQRLPPRLRTILVLRHFQGKTQVEVARDLGLSQAQVSRLEREALSRMRHLTGENR